MEAMRSKWTDERFDDRFGEINGRFDRLEAHMDSRFAEVNARLDSLNRSIVGGVVTLTVALILKGLLGG